MSVESVELKSEGDRITLFVTSCEMYPVGQYPEYAFVGDSTDGRYVRVLVPKASAERQLERLGLDMGSILKRTVTIKRDKNAKQPNKPYWGIYVEDGNGANKAGAAIAAPSAVPTPGKAESHPDQQQAPSPASPANGKEKLNKVYGRCLDHVLTVEVPKLKAAGVTVTHEGVSAMTSTLFIAAND